MAANPPGASAPPAATTASAADADATSTPSRDSVTASSGDKGDPSSASAGDMPVRTKESFDKLMVDRFMMRDQVATAALAQQAEQAKALALETRERVGEYRMIRNEYRPWFPPSRLYGEGYNGFGNAHTDLPGPPQQPPQSRIVYPFQKPRPGRRSTPGLRYKRKDMLKQADQHEELVPLRLEIEWDKVRLRDTFTWNLHERILPAELFAAQLVEDMGLKPPAAQPVYEQILHQIREQLNDFYPFAFSEEDALDPELPYSAYKNDEMRILIKLNITIGQHTLVDQFEWELNNPANSPEDFAAAMARDLSLSGEFTTAIAHCIREQSQLFARSLYSVGHPFDGRPVEDPDLTAAFLPTPLPNIFRPQQQAKDYSPYLYEMSELDLERTETIFSREQRRQKRSINRRGGPQLPDLRERQRTIRTLIVSSTLPGAAQTVEESRLYKRATGLRKRPNRDGDVSDSEDSDESVGDSPAPSILAQGTTRTRGMRGAASAAQQRMANLGRSETPEAGGIMHHHETRTSRRFIREETEDPAQLWVTLKVSRDKLRRLMRGDLRDIGQPRPGFSNPAPAHPMGGMPRSVPPTSAPPVIPQPGSLPPGQLGRIPAPPSAPGRTPPPSPEAPAWLNAALRDLERRYSNGDRFEAQMKYSYLDPVTELPINSTTQPLPEGVKYAWLPRIKCLDCTAKLYTPGPDKTVQKFEAHVKFSGHRDKVKLRLAGGNAGSPFAES